MLDKARENLIIAAKHNDWFHLEFVQLMQGDALSLQVENEIVDVTAHNWLFNIFERKT